MPENWSMPETPSKMQVYDMVKIDSFRDRKGGGELLIPPPPRIVSCLKYLGSVRVNTNSGDVFSSNSVYAILICGYFQYCSCMYNVLLSIAIIDMTIPPQKII